MALIDGTKLIVHANNNWTDFSDDPATADVNGATFSSPGKLGSHEGDFDGINDNVDYGNPSKLQIIGDITIACWSKRRADQQADLILWKANSYGLSYGGPVAQGLNKPALSLYLGGWQNLISPDAVDDVDSHLIIGTYDGTKMRLFVDGIYKTEVARTAAIGNDTHKLSLGSYELNSGSRGLYANILGDEFVIWNRAISHGGVSLGQQATGEVAELWNSGDGIEVGVEAGGQKIAGIFGVGRSGIR